ncbi:MAG: radical SAM protein [Elusimicrobia bacterium]|nr:radical SAM protein [Elusimicrobiota bacterium]
MKKLLSTARLLRTLLASNCGRPGYPLKLSFAVTYRCNLSCSMCRIWRKAPQPELSLEDIRRFFDRGRGFSWVGITGGEPFLREDLSGIVETVLDRCRGLRALHFATNGTLTDRVLDIVGLIRRRAPEVEAVFTVSVDGPPHLHDRIRGRQGVWKSAVETFLRLKMVRGVKAQVGFTLSRDNVGSFSAAHAALKEAYPALRFDDINVNVFQRSGFYYDNLDLDGPDEGPLLEEVRRILGMDREGWSVNNFLRRSYLARVPDFLSTRRCPLPCQALSTTCYLDPAGDLYPCAVFQRKLVNVRDMEADFGELWRSKPALSLAKECRELRCPSCWSPCDAFSAIGGSLPRVLAGNLLGARS